MLARFRVLLPYYLAIPSNEKLDEMEFDYEEYRVKIYPPMQANVDPSVYDITSDVPFIDVISDLAPIEEPHPVPGVKINGDEIIQANMFQIDLLAERDFDRDRASQSDDPPIELFFKLLNGTLRKLRAVGRLPYLSLIEQNSCGWIVKLLSNDGESLTKDDSHHHGSFQAIISWKLSNIRAATWKLTPFLSEDKLYVWETLILDAYAQMPSINAAIVLANAALEAFINFALDILAKESNLSDEAWKWISLRKGDWLKQPSAKEKYNQVFKLLTEKSLAEEDPKLWNAYIELRDARNAIAHEGKAIVRQGKKEIAVTTSMALDMLQNAEKIILWVEKFLPLEHQRLFNIEQIESDFNRLMTMKKEEQILKKIAALTTAKIDISILRNNEEQSE